VADSTAVNLGLSVSRRLIRNEQERHTDSGFLVAQRVEARSMVPTAGLMIVVFSDRNDRASGSRMAVDSGQRPAWRQTPPPSGAGAPTPDWQDLAQPRTFRRGRASESARDSPLPCPPR